MHNYVFGYAGRFKAWFMEFKSCSHESITSMMSPCEILWNDEPEVFHRPFCGFSLVTVENWEYLLLGKVGRKSLYSTINVVHLDGLKGGLDIEYHWTMDFGITSFWRPKIAVGFAIDVNAIDLLDY